jgi:PAS domain S-box-containing protein
MRTNESFREAPAAHAGGRDWSNLHDAEATRRVTEQLRASEALRASEERCRTLIETSFDGIVVTEDGIVTDANLGIGSMLGYAVEEMIGRPYLEFVHESRRDLAQRRIVDRVEGRVEGAMRGKDGRAIVVEVTARNEKVEGRARRIIAVRDLTGQRDLERQLRQAQKMEAVGRLAGGVAHDFNNLLTVISSYTELLLESTMPADPRHADLAAIRDAASGAASLTRQLLAFSRQQVTERKAIELRAAVTQSAKLLKRVIGEDIELALVGGEEPLVISIDPGQLEQVIMNLAVNARDAMPTGGNLTIETRVVEVCAEYAKAHPPAQPGRFAMVAISDNGIGMDECTRERAFEPFFTTKEPGTGTGLGLATVYGIVAQSGGFIWVYSEPGLGTQFKIYFPLFQGPPTTSDPAAPANDIGGTETILVVEDAPAVREAARRALERYGYNVIEAADGEAALRVALESDKRIDLLLTDIVMPGMGGRSVAELITRERGDLKVLFMSGYTDDAIVRQGVLSATTPYLQKPFSPASLARKVRETLGGRLASGDVGTVRAEA